MDPILLFLKDAQDNMPSLCSKYVLQQLLERRKQQLGINYPNNQEEQIDNSEPQLSIVKLDTE